MWGKERIEGKQKLPLCSMSSRLREAGLVISLALFVSLRARRGSLVEEKRCLYAVLMPLVGGGGYIKSLAVKAKVVAMESVPKPLR